MNREPVKRATESLIRECGVVQPSVSRTRDPLSCWSQRWSAGLLSHRPL